MEDESAGKGVTGEIAALNDEVKRLRKVLERAQQIIHDEYCSRGHHEFCESINKEINWKTNSKP